MTAQAFEPGMFAVAAGRRAPDELSPREREVLALLVSGRPNREIARLLHVSEGTVKTHLKRIFSKLGVRNRSEAALLGLPPAPGAR